MAALVMRGAAQVVIRLVQVIKRPDHMTLDMAGAGTITFIGAGGQEQPATGDQERWRAAKNLDFHSKSAPLISMAGADSDPLPDLRDCLVDYSDRICPMTALVMRRLAEFIARIQQSLQCVLHIALIRTGGLDEGNPTNGNG